MTLDQDISLPENIDEPSHAETAGAKNPVWLSVSEAAKFGGVNNKTIRRAIISKIIKYKVVKNRYFIELPSLIIYLSSSIKLKNKFYQYGFAQYVVKWTEKF